MKELPVTFFYGVGALNVFFFLCCIFGSGGGAGYKLTRLGCKVAAAFGGDKASLCGGVPVRDVIPAQIAGCQHNL